MHTTYIYCRCQTYLQQRKAQKATEGPIYYCAFSRLFAAQC